MKKVKMRLTNLLLAATMALGVCLYFPVAAVSAAGTAPSENDFYLGIEQTLYDVKSDSGFKSAADLPRTLDYYVDENANEVLEEYETTLKRRDFNTITLQEGYPTTSLDLGVYAYNSTKDATTGDNIPISSADLTIILKKSLADQGLKLGFNSDEFSTSALAPYSDAFEDGTRGVRSFSSDTYQATEIMFKPFGDIPFYNAADDETGLTVGIADYASTGLYFADTATLADRKNALFALPLTIPAGLEPGEYTIGIAPDNNAMRSGIIIGGSIDFAVKDFKIIVEEGNGGTAEPTPTPSDYTYVVLDDGTAEITGYTGTETDIEIPSEIDGYAVSSIGREAFSQNQTLTSVIIPDSVRSIGYHSFSFCKNLISVIIADSVTTIDDYAFKECDSLAEVTLPNNLKTIEICTFESCNSLLSIIIPDSVTSIEQSAFAGSGLTEITIPGSVTEIGYMAFNQCWDLVSLTLSDGLVSIDTQAFTSCELLTDVVIPDTVTSIGQGAFINCYGLTDVTLSENLTTIGVSAFEDCQNLTSITIPDSVTSIGDTAFSGCIALTFVTLPETSTTIGNGAFQSCYSLTEITLPIDLTTIGYSTFSGCRSLETIIIPDSVTSIGLSAFSETALTEVIIPNNVTEIGSTAFYQCEYLTSVVISDSVTEMGNAIFQGCTSLTSVTLSNKLISVPTSIFQNCSALTEVTIPKSVTEIGVRAFYGCENLTSITIPENVTKIDNSAFDYCEDVTIYGYTGSYAQSYAEENGIPFIDLNYLPTQITATVKKVYPTSAKIFIERTAGDAKGAISYVLLYGDYSDFDFSDATLEDMENHPDFVQYAYSNWTKNVTFNISNLDTDTTYTIVPFAVKKKVYSFGLGENTAFTTTDIALETVVKSVTDDIAKFKISRTGAVNGALGYVLLKGDVADNFNTLEEYQTSENFLANQISKWTGSVTVTVTGIESGETYTVVPYTQKGGVYTFGLGENITFTAE